MQLVSGQKIALNQVIQNDQKFTLRVQFKAAFDVDISSFGIGQNDQLFHDDYMTFYNQPQTPHCEVQYHQQENLNLFTFDLSKINATQTPRFVICATVANDQATMQNIQSGQISLVNQQGEVLANYQLNPSNFSQEKAVMLTEIYFKNALWRMAAIGQGFNGGLTALVRHFGGEVAENSSPAPTASKIDLKKKVVLDKVEKFAPHLLDLTKKSLISLEKNKLLEVKARVALILDYSGSMSQQYKCGDVQKVMDRIIPLAINFDDDGSFECWAFAEKALRLNDVSLNNLNNYIASEQGGYKKWNAGAGYNNEPAILEEVLHYFTQESPSNLPVYIVFISDGGVSEARKIKKILQEASLQPIFWQFVGIGGRNYGVLEKLDTMEGRVVDNCNFFKIDNIESISESMLYDFLLQEFPIWLTEAKNKNIVRG